MGKRKTKRKPQAKIREKLDTQFNCLFCNHEKSVTAKLNKSTGVGDIKCRICQASWQCNITPLSHPIDVYSEWIDACEEQNQATSPVAQSPALPSPFGIGRSGGNLLNRIQGGGSNDNFFATTPTQARAAPRGVPVGDDEEDDLFGDAGVEDDYDEDDRFGHDDAHATAGLSHRSRTSRSPEYESERDHGRTSGGGGGSRHGDNGHDDDDNEDDAIREREADEAVANAIMASGPLTSGGAQEDRYDDDDKDGPSGGHDGDPEPALSKHARRPFDKNRFGDEEEEEDEEEFEEREEENPSKERSGGDDEDDLDLEDDDLARPQHVTAAAKRRPVRNVPDDDEDDDAE